MVCVEVAPFAGRVRNNCRAGGLRTRAVTASRPIPLILKPDPNSQFFNYPLRYPTLTHQIPEAGLIVIVHSAWLVSRISEALSSTKDGGRREAFPL